VPLNTKATESVGEQADALVELVLLSRTKYFIGTRYSTYSMLIAAMRPQQEHWMVYPAVHEGCVKASSPYNSLSHFDKKFLTGGTFSIWGALGAADCVNQVTRPLSCLSVRLSVCLYVGLSVCLFV
jgi:hypothetical protein